MLINQRDTITPLQAQARFIFSTSLQLMVLFGIGTAGSSNSRTAMQIHKATVRYSIWSHPNHKLTKLQYIIISECRVFCVCFVSSPKRYTSRNDIANANVFPRGRWWMRAARIQQYRSGNGRRVPKTVSGIKYSKVRRFLVKTMMMPDTPAAPLHRTVPLKNRGWVGLEMLPIERLRKLSAATVQHITTQATATPPLRWMPHRQQQ